VPVLSSVKLSTVDLGQYSAAPTLDSPTNRSAL
jgi:hypothetical protein